MLWLVLMQRMLLWPIKMVLIHQIGAVLNFNIFMEH